MKKILILTVAALFAGSAAADAGVKRVVIDLAPSAVISAAAIDTSAVSTLPKGLVWLSDATQEDGEPAIWLIWSYTAAGNDSFSVLLDYIGPDGNVAATTTVAAAAFTSGAYNTNVALAPGFPPEGIRIRMSNMDSGANATTATSAKVIILVDN